MDYRRIVNQVVVCAAVAVLASVAQAGTLYVDDDNCPGPGSGTPGDPYCSIQTAINNAVDTDEILVAPGTYYEMVGFIGKAIALRSTVGPAVTIIDRQLAGPVVACADGEGPDTVLDGFTIQGGGGFDGGGMINIEASPTVINCTFTGNVAGHFGAGMYNWGSSPAITNCTFSGNTAGDAGGGMYNFVSSPAITNCLFIGNTVDHRGGGIYNGYQSHSEITSCTFSGNTAGIDGGGLFDETNYSSTVVSCIFWGNSPDEIHGPTTVIYSDVQGGWAGAGNIDADPMYVDGPGGNYRLSAGSPGIDAGMSLGIDTDLDGNRRAVDDPATPDTGIGCGGPVCDMGAYEFGSTPPCLADIDRNGTVNVNDFLLLLAGWGTCP